LRFFVALREAEASFHANLPIGRQGYEEKYKRGKEYFELGLKMLLLLKAVIQDEDSD